MADLVVSLPDDVLHRLRQQAASRGLASPEDLVRDLVDAELQNASTSTADHELLEAELLRRMESDDWVVMDASDYRSIRDEVTAELSKRKK